MRNLFLFIHFRFSNEFLMRTTTADACVLFGANVKDIHDHDSYQAGISLTDLGHELDRDIREDMICMALVSPSSIFDGDQELM